MAEWIRKRPKVDGNYLVSVHIPESVWVGMAEWDGNGRRWYDMNGRMTGGIRAHQSLPVPDDHTWRSKEPVVEGRYLGLDYTNRAVVITLTDGHWRYTTQPFARAGSLHWHMKGWQPLPPPFIKGR